MFSRENGLSSEDRGGICTNPILTAMAQVLPFLMKQCLLLRQHCDLGVKDVLVVQHANRRGLWVQRCSEEGKGEEKERVG